MTAVSRQKVFRVLTVIWMTVIFLLSARDADLSTADSHRAGMTVGRIVYRDFKEWPETRQESFAARIDHPVRKTAHALEYALLSLLLLGSFLPGYSPDRRLFYSVLLSLAGCFLYACTDEIHQMFVPGRSGMFSDVLIDCSGALAALFCTGLFLRLRAGSFEGA